MGHNSAAHISVFFCKFNFYPIVSKGVQNTLVWNMVKLSKTKRKKNQINEMVFCFQNCSDLLWGKVVQHLKFEAKSQKFWDHQNNLFKQGQVRTVFKTGCSLTYSWRFLRSSMYFGTIIIQIRNLQEKLQTIMFFIRLWIKNLTFGPGCK